jgi:hypothetical protein
MRPPADIRPVHGWSLAVTAPVSPITSTSNDGQG